MPVKMNQKLEEIALKENTGALFEVKAFLGQVLEQISCVLVDLE